MPIGFRMDATEVTRQQYAAWIDSVPDTSAQDAVCVGNATFVPDETCLADPRVCAGADCDDHPQVCVDWCDAQAFCQAGGRHLCANPEGGSVTWDRYADTFLDQFYYVCSADAKQNYVYGIDYDPQACNVNERADTGCLANCATVPVGSLDQCHGAMAPAFPGAYDLIGNVAEWEDCCETDDATSLCRARGGDMAGTEDTAACDASLELQRNEFAPTVGFRCCSD